MKKEIKKLSLNKKTISNLQPMEMEKKVGGMGSSYWGGCGSRCLVVCGGTKNGNTCNGHNTCQYTCV